MSWVEAERYCGFMHDSHLASVTNEWEMMVVACEACLTSTQQNFPPAHMPRAPVDSHWIGGSVNITDTDGGWAWIDGMPFEYTNWMKSETFLQIQSTLHSVNFAFSKRR